MYPEEFKTALVFLKGGKSYLDKQEWTITMLEKIQTISKILGLGKDIKASEAALNALEKRREEEWNNYKEIN
jgi:hypothetical protein